MLNDLSCQHQIVVTTDGRGHLLLYDDRSSLQLVFDRPFHFNTPLYFDTQISLDILPEQSNSVVCLETLLRLQRFPKKCLRLPPKTKGSTLLLFAWDLRKKGLSRKNIARKIYGFEAVERGWEGVTDNIKTKTKRLIKKMIKFIKGGYLIYFKKE